MENTGVNQFGKTSSVLIRSGFREGRTILEDVAFTAPYKIMAPFEKENGGIQVMPLCASAGIMKGDCQEFTYYIGKNSNLEILSQSFDKIHKMDGGCASRKIRIQVEENAVLSYYPQPVIPFADSAFDSDMEIRLADETSHLFLLDILTCGRCAYNERFAYRRFSSKIRVYRGSRLIYRDNTRYEPALMPMEGIGMYEGYTHMANIFLTACNGNEDEIWTILDSFPDCEGGVTRLASGDLALRVFGSRAQTLQALAARIKILFER
ncbi:MAG: urease accessory protein UreD [Eubacteriales bacterium]|nr:urease accessory protein UreD [Eubacteriales bacterium]